MGSTLLNNLTSVPGGTSNSSPLGAAKHVVTKASASPWTWLAVTCALLGISGGIRSWRDHRFRTLAQESATCPFPLNDLPKVLGSWQAIEGLDTQLDPEVARIAGSSDHVIRTYVHEKSGEKVSVLVLYGLANSVFAHTPEVCFPAAGYRAVATPAPADHQFSTADSASPVSYRTAFFTKNVGGIDQYEEVLHAFLHNGQWLPDVASRWKLFRYHPGMFKILLQRRVPGTSTEKPLTESLFKEIVREIDSRILNTSHTPQAS
jgi:hypothetical protein